MTIRRAGAPRLIDWTGERCVPWAPDVQVVYEHFHRYMWASQFVEGKRVLDLGSGEGFGAAILAQDAAGVLGIDIDGQTVRHSSLNYEGENLSFAVGTALDLSAYGANSFDIVVAFEIIEHVQDHDRVLEEIARVLTPEGTLIISTPDRVVYSDVEGRNNPYHEHELSRDELEALLTTRFPHTALWGQHTITGSYMRSMTSPSEQDHGRDGATSEFFVDQSGDEWHRAGDPVEAYLVALASRAPLSVAATGSTLADYGLQLVREKERDLVHMASARESVMRERDDLLDRIERDADAIAQSGAMVLDRQRDIAGLRGELAAMATELEAARQLNRRVEESVSWQAFEKGRNRLYAAIGEQSLMARGVRLSLRTAGRAMRRTPAQHSEERERRMLALPEHSRPRVSLIIPLYARADLTRACLQSIRDYTGSASYEVILVDDDADHETKQLLDDVTGARIIRNDKNIGYLKSMNRGASFARGDWLVLFNNDTEVRPGWLSAMLSSGESADDIAVVAPKFVYPDGSLNEAGALIWRDGTGANYGRGDAPEGFRYEYRREVDYGSAAALMARADFWRAAGGFDDRYEPMYYEDADLCFQARERGLRVMFEPEAVVVHVEGATAGTDTSSGAKRHQEDNRPKFTAKWRHRLDSEHLPPRSADVRRAAHRHRGPHVLIVDYRVPTWDRDAGSLRMLGIVQALLARGARVSFLPDNLQPMEPYTRVLQRMGVEVLYGPIDMHAELAAICATLDAAIVCRPNIASRWLDSIRELAPAATVIYDTVDLHWLREARRHAVNGSFVSSLNGAEVDLSSLTPKAAALRELELAMIRATDATFVVTDAERLHVERDVPGSRLIVLPMVHDIAVRVSPPAERSGILFVGGFAHTPNVDAAVKLVRDVMPAVWRELHDVRVSIVGADAPPEVKSLATARVDVMGWVEDLQPLLERSRLLLAPLTYGAGIKGKVTQCLAAGLPVVTTTIGAEGLGTGDAMLVSDDPAGLAAHAVSLCRDDDLWERLSRAGQALIATTCSRDIVAERVLEALTEAPRDQTSKRFVSV